ncbi:HDOD domain-containing protein, partial [Xanthomonas perforans]
MMLVTVLLLAAGLLGAVVLAGGLWWLLARRRDAKADDIATPSASNASTAHASPSPIAPAPSPAAPLQQPVPPPAAQTLQIEPPPMRPLLRRMYAAVMATPSLAEGTLPGDPAQAEVLAAVAAALEQVDLRPQLLPRRPHLLPQLMRAVNDPDASGRGIAAIIAQDPALAANLLRIANSALYRPQGGPLESLERAVVHIGTEGVRQIVAAAVMQPVLSLDGGLYSRLPAAVWDYALRTATAAAAYL